MPSGHQISCMKRPDLINARETEYAYAVLRLEIEILSPRVNSYSNKKAYRLKALLEFCSQPFRRHAS